MKTKYWGITLMETLVYIGLFGLIFISVVVFMLGVSDDHKLTQDRVAIDRYKVYLYSHLEESIQWASEIDGTSSIFDTSPSVLVYTHNDGATIHNLKYELIGGQLYVTRDGNTEDITPSGITVTQFVVEDIQNINGDIVGVKVDVRYELEGNSNVGDNVIQVFRLF